MRLGSKRNDNVGRTAAETETDQRRADGTAAESGTAQPTFTPAARRPGDDMADETACQNAAVTQPGDPAGDYGTTGGYRGTGNAASSGERGDQPVVRYAQAEQADSVEPTGNYQPGQTAAPAGNYAPADREAPAGHNPAVAPATAATAAAPPAPTPAPAGGAALNQPLLSGNTELLQRWQQVQAQFVEDPRVAVAGAADLVEQAARALVDALEERQRHMRGLWDRGGSAAPGDPVDTEQMRQLMQRYRALFNQLYHPA